MTARGQGTTDACVMTPRCLVIGHVTRDLVGRSCRLGGTAAYAALTAHRLGWPTGVVTSAGPDWDPQTQLPGVQVHHSPAPATTTFRNRYHRGRRTQRILATARPLSAQDVPPSWRGCSAVLLAPVAQEVVPDLALLFPDALRGAVLQGWLRRWGSDGRIWPGHCEPQELSGRIDVAVLSQEEVPDAAWLVQLRAHVPVVIVTAGVRGSTLYASGREHPIDAFPRAEADPTGAGDVYAAAFLVRYQETADPPASALFASAAASFCVEAPGVAGIPTRAQVEARLLAGC